MGPYGQALDFRQISQSQITLPLRRPVRQTPSRVCNAAVSLNYACRLLLPSVLTKAFTLSADLQTVEAPHKTQTLGELTRPQFPILHQEVNGKPLIYLDNSATSQKPNQVRQAMEEYYGPTGCNSNVHRGVHNLSSRATAAYEQARDKIANFIHARVSREIVFVKNASEGINLIANTWGTANIKEGDEVNSTACCLLASAACDGCFHSCHSSQAHTQFACR